MRESEAADCDSSPFNQVISLAQLPVSNCLPEQGVVNINNISFENNQITIDVFLQITIPLPSELSIQNLDLGEDAIKNGMAKDSME